MAVVLTVRAATDAMVATGIANAPYVRNAVPARPARKARNADHATNAIAQNHAISGVKRRLTSLLPALVQSRHRRRKKRVRNNNQKLQSRPSQSNKVTKAKVADAAAAVVEAAGVAIIRVKNANRVSKLMAHQWFL